MIANAARQEGDSGECGAILLCLAECILACLARIVEYFNKVSPSFNLMLPIRSVLL